MPNLDDGKPNDFLTDRLTDTAVSFLDKSKRDTPFLLYFAYYTVHSPLMVPPALVAKYQEKAKDFNNTKNEDTNPASDEKVIGMDFYPTLLEFSGLDALPDEHKDGFRIAPLLTGATKSLDRDTPLYWHYPYYHRTKPYGAIRDRGWKLISELWAVELKHEVGVFLRRARWSGCA